MRQIKTVVVEKAIFHELTRSTSGTVQLRLSSVPLVFDHALPDPDPVADYLTEHVERSVTDGVAVAASFDDPELPTPHAIAGTFDNDDFVESSQNVARQLFELLELDGRISPGTLAILNYVADGGARCVGLIKFDPSVGFTLVEQDVEGERGLVLAPVDGVLPSVRERLQKCAFVRATSGDDYQLLALDRQTRGDEVANWFLHRFLTASPVATPQTRTQDFYKAATHARQVVEDEMDQGQIRRLDAARDQALRDNHISVDDFVDRRDEFATDDARSRYRAVLEESLIDKDFDVDRPTAEKLLKKAKYIGDGSMVLNIATDELERVGDLETDPIDGRSYVKLWTETWHRK